MTTTRTRIAAGLTLAAGLVLAAPLAASAHVTVTPDAPIAGGYDVLTFAFGHGCDGSPTTALQIDIPDGLDSVTPTIEPGWSIDVQRDEQNGLVSQVTYTADEPIADDRRATIELGVKYAEDAAGTLPFPVEQVCAEGSTSWSELVAEGEDPHSVDHPAPTVTLGTAAAHDAEAAADTEATPEPEAAAGPLPLALGGAGLAASVAALVVAVLALRRSSRRS